MTLRQGDVQYSSHRSEMVSHLVKAFLAVITIWFLVIGLLALLPGQDNNSNSSNKNMPSNSAGSGATVDILGRLDIALQEFESIKINNAEMKRIITQNLNPDQLESEHRTGVLDSNGPGSSLGEGDPSETYEKTRRQLELDVKELWYNVQSKSVNIGESDMKAIESVYKQVRAHLIQLRNSDGFENYRKRETEALSALIQGRIHQLQNPEDCSKARKLVCTLNKGCGFGCQVHHVGYCLVVAYATSRTLILESKGWRYNRQGWEKVFMPISETCTTQDGKSRGDWSSKQNVQVLQLPIVDFLKPRPPYLPVAIPFDLADRLEMLHGEPQVWWVGQFMKYLLRLQPQTQELIDESKGKMDLGSPIVGIHVRRTDKIGTEASYHTLKEYMDHAAEYFDIIRKVKNNVKRRVFIASDDPGVITEAMKKYPGEDWEILGDKGVAQSAAVAQRYNGLLGIIKDVFLLAECDIIICTFSSQVCRLAYEILQSRHADASQRFVSLDDIYYYGGGIGTPQLANEDHFPVHPNEIELKAGDTIAVAGNHWNGMSKGTNQRTNKIGLYPSYKARNKHLKIDFPENKWWK